MEAEGTVLGSLHKDNIATVDIAFYWLYLKTYTFVVEFVARIYILMVLYITVNSMLELGTTEIHVSPLNGSKK